MEDAMESTNSEMKAHTFLTSSIKFEVIIRDAFAFIDNGTLPLLRDWDGSILPDSQKMQTCRLISQQVCKLQVKRPSVMKM